MKLKSRKRNLLRPILGSVIFHIVILFVFDIISLDTEFQEENNILFIEIKSKEIEINKSEPFSKKEVEKQKMETNDRINEKVLYEEQDTDSTNDSITETDTLNVAEDKIVRNESQIFDSLIVNNPSLMSLKYALSKQLKLDNITESDSAFIVRRLKESVIDYYRIKYPTPLSEFGEPNQGIAIDKIIDLFSADDDIDEKKIKKYLGIE